MEALLFEIVNPEQKRQIVEELDLDFAYQHTKARFRANYFYRMAGLGAVFRFIPSKVLTLADLGVSRRPSRLSPSGATGSSSSPGRPAPANRPRWRR